MTFIQHAFASQRGGTLISAALVALIVVASAPAELHVAVTAQDEGAFLLYPDLILHGAVAQRDFHTHYGPGMTWIVAAAYLVGGHSMVVERVVGLSMHLAIGVLIVLIAARWGSRMALACGTLAAILLTYAGPTAKPILAGFILVLASILVMSRGDSGAARSTWKFAVAGVLGSLALTFRPDMAPAVALSALPFLIRSPRFAPPYIAGGLIGLIPLAVHVLVASPGAVFQNVFDAVFRNGRHLPIPPTGLLNEGALALALGSLLLGVVASGVAWRRANNSGSSRLILSATLFSLGYLSDALQRDDSSHTLGAELVAISLVPVYLFILCSYTRLRAPRVRHLLIAAVSLATLCGGLLTARGLVTTLGVTVSNQGRQVFVSSDVASDAQAVLTVVDRIAKPGQRLFVGPLDMRRTNYNDTYLYFLLPQLHPSTYYLEMEPLNANGPDSGLAADVASADVVVLTSEWDSWPEPSTLGSAQPNVVIMKDFCARATVGVYHVFTRCTH